MRRGTSALAVAAALAVFATTSPAQAGGVTICIEQTIVGFGPNGNYEEDGRYLVRSGDEESRVHNIYARGDFRDNRAPGTSFEPLCQSSDYSSDDGVFVVVSRTPDYPNRIFRRVVLGYGRDRAEALAKAEMGLRAGSMSLDPLETPDYEILEWGEF